MNQYRVSTRMTHQGWPSTGGETARNEDGNIATYEIPEAPVGMTDAKHPCEASGKTGFTQIASRDGTARTLVVF